MTSQLITQKLTDRSVVATCPLGISLPATGLMSAALLPVLPTRVRSERPTEAPAVAAAAKVKAHAFTSAAAANGAGNGTAKGAEGANGYANGQQKTQQYGKWAFRGLEPWSDPA
ncbi:hypothetical protein [Actinacidiphila bryophytorum]|uniref:Uncharacterized protein n=1 Tax=Actinacidiphila bryophytorum TaxID=1436133 RepID=A0A9W4GXQ6_9ACTN|nr:hypothetical protein [Actinacidiphila bryophytorum]MBM9440532.1 hypothetical protein [Actinacidiphila bryophytorum]MBN6547174.1 hypothetical protein [Actinacidiphila bryophytorum]CAG7604516.1 conserved hypothetical protein [Actinacidiphila bryophytorum]